MEMCWSVLMHPEGGIPPPTRGGAHMAALGERPAEEEEEIVGRLGFDVVRRDLSEGMECIEVRTLLFSVQRMCVCYRWFIYQIALNRAV